MQPPGSLARRFSDTRDRFEGIGTPQPSFYTVDGALLTWCERSNISCGDHTICWAGVVAPHEGNPLLSIAAVTPRRLVMAASIKSSPGAAR